MNGTRTHNLRPGIDRHSPTRAIMPCQKGYGRRFIPYSINKADYVGVKNEAASKKTMGNVFRQERDLKYAKYTTSIHRYI